MNREVNKLSNQATALAAMLVAACLSGTGAHAAERQELLALRNAVIAFVIADQPDGAEVEVVPDALDPRLRLEPCQDPLEAFWAPGSSRVGQVSVGVRCAGTRPWKLYIPTRVKSMQPVVVAARALTRGQRLAPADLSVEKRDAGQFRPGAVHDPREVEGYVMTRPMAAGQVLDAGALQAPVLVERGRRVRMAVEAAGIQITMSGLALEDGALGETVQVRNPASRRVVEGIVVGPAQIRLRTPALLQRVTASQ